MKDLKQLEVWFVTGSQDLYGEETLKQVAEHSRQIASSINDAKNIPLSIVFKPTVKSTEEIYNVCLEANTSKKLHRHHCVDAYLLSSQDVDQRFESIAEAHVAPAYAI